METTTSRLRTRAWEAKKKITDPAYWRRKQARYRKDYPENIQRSKQARREWLKAGDLTILQLHEIYLQQQGQCHYCHTQVLSVRFSPLHLIGFDHLIPRPLGGQHTKSNVVLCCSPCNIKKARRFPQAMLEDAKNGVKMTPTISQEGCPNCRVNKAAYRACVEALIKAVQMLEGAYEPKQGMSNDLRAPWDLEMDSVLPELKQALAQAVQP